MKLNKKGINIPVILAVATVILLAYAFLAFNYLGDKPITKVIGASQSEIIDTFNKGNIFLAYVDQSARLSGYESIVKLADNGGLVESECRKINNYNLWLKGNKECYPYNLERSYLHYFAGLFENLLLKHDLIDDNLDYDFNVDSGSLIIKGETNEKIFIRNELDFVLGEAEKLPKEGTILDEKIKEDFSDLITKYSDKYNLDENLIRAVIKKESDFNSEAVSPAGAKGLMQLTEGVVSDLSDDKTKLGRFCNLIIKDVFDPEQNINGGSCYLAYLLDKYEGKVELALAAYNWGSGNVDENCRSGFLFCENLPDETEDYVPGVLAFRKIFERGEIDVTSAAIREIDEKVKDIKIDYKVNPSFRQKIDYDLEEYDRIISIIKENLECLRSNKGLFSSASDCIENDEFDWKIVNGENDVLLFDVSTKYKLFGDNVVVKFAIDFNNI